MIAMEENTARPTSRRGFSVSSASAAEFSQPTNRYTARGKPAASPLRPWLMWLGRNGSRERRPRCSTSAAIGRSYEGATPVPA